LGRVPQLETSSLPAAFEILVRRISLFEPSR
jgi:hypothetical protein